MGFTSEDLGSDALNEELGKLNPADLVNELEIGEITIKDIIDDLMKPGRDPRDELSKPLLKQDVLKMEDLQTGMELQGTVRNVVDFGAFVDIGVKQDGLVHISKLSNRFVKHPLDVVAVRGCCHSLGRTEVDSQKQRVSLTMLEPKGSKLA